MVLIYSTAIMSIESKIPPFVALTLSASLLSGCASEQNFTAPVIENSESKVSFQSAPEVNFHVSNCETQSNSWATYIDSDPYDSNTNDMTVGFTEVYSQEGYPIAVRGATIRSLGGFAYEVVTSDDMPGETTRVDLTDEPLARVVEGGEGYDIALSARVGDDGRAYFRTDCLPDIDFPYTEEAPADEVPLVPVVPLSPPFVEA